MNQQNNPRDGLLPVSPLSEPIIAEPIVAEPIIVMLAQLVEVMIMLTHISTMQLTNNLSKAKTIQKPASFKRTEGGDSHRFLFTFNLWASVQCIALNVVNEQGHIVKKHQVEWIWAALSYLQDNVAIWASSAMKEFSWGAIPFISSYDMFYEQFKARFKTVDEAVNAKKKLHNLK